MIKKLAFIWLIFLSFQVFGWGMTGHRTVGEVAEFHLTKKTKKQLDRILSGESLAVVSNWMDDIKSDSKYDSLSDWHWVTIPGEMTYEQTEKNPDGDVIAGINLIVAALKKGGLSKTDEAEYIKMLVHLVGDIHQPLHVGTGEDQGGNQVKLKWFWENSNLHRVWDSGMIDSKQYSYTELTDIVNKVSDTKVEKWQQASVEEWAYESIRLREAVYDLPEDKNINYEYRYENWETVKLRLAQAGVRLAGLLNDIYG